jgi:hypothetical protein
VLDLSGNVERVMAFDETNLALLPPLGVGALGPLVAVELLLLR